MLVLVLVVVGVAVAVLAALSSVTWFDPFLTSPYASSTIAGRDDVETAVLMTACGARRHRDRAVGPP